MKNTRKITALVLALVMAFSFSLTVFAQSSGSRTEQILSSVSQAGRFKASVTSFSYNSGNVTNNIKFDIYDDLKADKILCDFTDKNIKVLYSDSSISVIFSQFFSYLTFSLTDVTFAPVIGGVKLFQKTFKSFVDDPTLSAFTLTTSSVVRNGRNCTLEYYKGNVVGTSGSFYYDETGRLCEILLSDNVGEYIGFTLSDFTTAFDSSVFSIPLYYFNLSLFWKILQMILPMLGVSIPFITL
ncbi:MAG: hypothetical protein IJK60_08190 [Clostridia bacterium]|nr:hypothetical protein [Clostridia bacterium]